MRKLLFFVLNTELVCSNKQILYVDHNKYAYLTNKNMIDKKIGICFKTLLKSLQFNRHQHQIYQDKAVVKDPTFSHIFYHTY